MSTAPSYGRLRRFRNQISKVTQNDTNISVGKSLLWKQYEETEVVINSCLIPLIILGNSLIIVVIIKMGSRSRTVNDILVVSLAVADLFVGLYVLPLEVAKFVKYQAVAKLPVSTCFFEQSVYLQPLCWSIQNMFLIAVNCCFSLMAPIKHRIWVTSKVAVIAVSVAFGIGASYTVITYTTLPTGLNGKQCRLTIAKNNFGITVYPIIVFVVTAIINIKIIQMAGRKVIPRQGQHNVLKAKLMSTIFMIFVVCWLPISVLVIIEEFNSKFQLYSKIITRSLLTLAHANSAINCIVYFSKSARFREEVKRLFQRLGRNRIAPFRPNRSGVTMATSS